MIHRRFPVVAAFACVLAFDTAPAADPPWLARSRSGMVATDSPEASRIGAEVLAAGGNAFDAAIATSCALAVARPQSTGLGGGGFLVAYVAREQQCIVLDFREKAPAGATAERYARLAAEHAQTAGPQPVTQEAPNTADAARAAGTATAPAPSIYGGNAVGVPGQVAGLAAIHKRYATRPWRDLLEPARRLAETGFTVDEHYRGSCREALEDFAKWPALKNRYHAIYATLLGDGTPPERGAKLKRPDLARALLLIAERGPEAFYRGEIAAAIVKAVQAAGGPLTLDDLADYRVREREPLRGRFGMIEIVTMPPPSSGGVCLLQALNTLHAAALRPELREAPSQEHVFIEALKHAFADRARWLGDPDFTPLPTARLLNRTYAADLAGRIDPQRTLPTADYGSAQLEPTTRPSRPAPDDRGTSHFCVADRDGNVVALTETINGVFGSLVVAEPYGIVLNNQMDDFTTEPGKPNLFGLVQGAANLVGPGKRPLSSMSPTIVFQDGKPALALGASGGPRIITSVLQVLLYVVEREMPLEEALAARRLHHQWQPDEVCFDRPPPAEAAESLVALAQAGHKLSDKRRTGVVQAIQFLPDGTLVGASDPRKDGRPASVEDVAAETE